MAGLNFTSLRRWRLGNSQAQDGRLLEQFFVTLDGSLKQLVRSGGAAARHDDIVAEVTKLLAEAPSWRTAYHVEQLMVPLYGGAALEVELQRRMTEMRKFDAVIAATYDALLADADEAARRACLGRLINDLQWRYEQRNLKRHYTQSVTIKTSLIFFGAFIVFFLPKNVLDPEVLRAMPRHVVLHMAISAGLVGAAFSMLIGLRQRLEASTLDELRNTQRLPFLLSRAVIGAGAGLILYYVHGVRADRRQDPARHHPGGRLHPRRRVCRRRRSERRAAHPVVLHLRLLGALRAQRAGAHRGAVRPAGRRVGRRQQARRLSRAAPPGPSA